MKNKKTGLILLSILIVVGLTCLTLFFQQSKTLKIKSDLYDAYVTQEILEVKNQVQEQTALYYKGDMIGVLSDPKVIPKMLEEVYQKEYKKAYPKSSLSLGIDIHEQKFFSMQTYENKDDEILKFIKDHKLFSVEVLQVSFSNGSVLYIDNEKTYNAAKEKYTLCYVGEEALNSEKQENVAEFGRTIKSFGFEEEEIISKGYAPVEMVLQNEDEIVSWFLKGYNNKKLYYVVEDGDTVQGAASKNSLGVVELLALNYGTILKENQLLDAGTKLEVTQVISPVNYRVEKEATNKVTLYPESPQYIADDTLPLGVQKVIQQEKLGYKKEVVNEIYINGKLSDYEVKSTQNIVAPKQMIVHYGTQRNSNYVDSGNLNSGHISAGNFRYPCYNAMITCSWGCYYGHQAMDVVNLYSRYGEVIASDSGVVITNSYDGINGYHVRIDHGNGFVTHYGHMNKPGYVQVGEYVERGQVIGQIGQTGVATGPHIHFEIRYNGQKMDPALYLR